MEKTTPKELALTWLASLESENIELDNLDKAKLVYDVNTESVVVQNEHGTQFPVSDLSQAEIDIFYANITENY